MKPSLIGLVLATVAVIVSSLHADNLIGVDAATPPAVMEIVERNECYACHATSEIRIGPSYQMISARHSARKDVMEEVLARKIILGGSGNWGVVPMVANEKVSLAEARLVAQWILHLEFAD
jgi:cytochrome c